MNKPATLQDLIDFAARENIDPTKCFLLIREKCMVGGDHREALVDPERVENIEVWDEDDGHIAIPLAITLIKLEGVDDI